MPQIFHRSANTLAKLSIVVGGLAAVSVLGMLYAIQVSPYVTEVRVVKDQPIPFSHEHHVGGLGLDCRYCHHTVEKTASATIPPVATCYNCHKVVWGDAPMLKPVRDAYKNDTPIEWNKVHDLPDFAYFNHSAHVNKGVGCMSCHGRVDKMPMMWKEKTLYMGFCLDCHRNPEPNLRPVEAMTDMEWEPSEEWKETDKFAHLGIKKTKPGHINQLTNCAVCHR